MEISTFDLLLLFVLSLVLALMIGMNVVYVVNEKLSNIQVNMPKTTHGECRPVINLRLQDGKLLRVDDSNIENGNSNGNGNNNIEGFETTDHHSVDRRTTFGPLEVSTSLVSLDKISADDIGTNAMDDFDDPLAMKADMTGGIGSKYTTRYDTNVQNGFIPNDKYNHTKRLEQGYVDGMKDIIEYPGYNDMVSYTDIAKNSCRYVFGDDSRRRVKVSPDLSVNCKDKRTFEQGKINRTNFPVFMPDGSVVNKNVNLYVPHTYFCLLYTSDAADD